MKDNILQLFSSFIKNEIDEKFFSTQFKSSTGSDLTEGYCLEKINEGIQKHDGEMIDIFIQIGLVVAFTSKSIPILCKLLGLNCHHKHEDIAMLFKEFRDPDTVNCLYNAAELKFEYLAYDETYQFARKCIKALSAIEDENAIQKLKMLQNSKTPEIAEYARKELRYKGLL